MGVWLKTLLVVGILGVLAAGCDIGPVGTPSPNLTKVQVAALEGCQEAIKFWSRHFTAVKSFSVGECADKILALQLLLDNQLITPEQFDLKLAKVRSECDKSFKLVTKASTDLATQIHRLCDGSVEDLIFDTYDPLQFVALGANPGTAFIEPITSVADIIRYQCFTGEIFTDLTVFYQIPRLTLLFDTADISIVPPRPVSDRGPGEVGIFLDERCFTGVPP